MKNDYIFQIFSIALIRESTILSWNLKVGKKVKESITLRTFLFSKIISNAAKNIVKIIMGIPIPMNKFEIVFYLDDFSFSKNVSSKEINRSNVLNINY